MPVNQSLVEAEELSLKPGTLKYSKKELYKIEAFQKYLKKGIIPGEARAVRLVERKDKKTGKTILMKMNPKKYPVPHINMKKELKLKQMRLRKSIQPGVIGIVLKGDQRAKRVVCLKQIDSGLLLVCNPVGDVAPTTVYHQLFLATKMKIDVSGVKIPEEMTHEYFHNKRQERRDYRKALKKASVLGEDRPKMRKSPEDKMTPERLAINKKLEDQLTPLITGHPEGETFVQYMKSLFSLGANDYPHRMKW